MSQNIQISKERYLILMKSDLCHWVTKDTAQRIQEALQRQSGHTFMKISELGITINTAQIEGVYTTEQYSDMLKIKQKMWQCEYKVWHGQKNECECEKNARITHSDLMKKIKEDKDRISREKELTPAEQEANVKKLSKIRSELEEKGILSAGQKMQMFARGRRCVKCSNELPQSSKYYCSGSCMEKAKSDGTLDHEEELKEAANTI